MSIPDPSEWDADWYIERGFPDKLLNKLAEAPIVPEKDIPAHIGNGTSANAVVRRMREETLSERELEVLKAVSHGLEMKMVGELLHIEEETVKTHLKRVRYILKAKTTLHAVAIALRKGIIE